jgi:hypothetical protein
MLLRRRIKAFHLVDMNRGVFVINLRLYYLVGI